MFNNKKIHFIGIGGVSMSGIAEILLSKGATITGSDVSENKFIKKLRERNVNIFIGENEDLVKDVDIVVYTAAIKSDNKELVMAKNLNKEVYERSTFLGLLTKEYKNVLCISGTHGKSTTTGMISNCFIKAKKNPTIQIGAYLPIIDGNYFVGDNDYFIMESCEYQDSFLKFFPTTEIILNIDDDHLDYFKNMDNVLKSYKKYTELLNDDQYLIINNDDDNIKKLNLNKEKILTYGINNNSNLMAKNISYDEYGHPTFDVYYNNELFLNIKLNILGNHNIYNSLACILMCIIHNIDKDSIKEGLYLYKGVERRFELIGTYKDNILVYDDYAHHPTEIKSTLDSVKNIKCNQNWAVFQSHTYSRTFEHLNEFGEVLSNFDNIIIAPIYPAREINTWGVKEEQLVELINRKNTNVIYLDSYDSIVSYLKDNLKDNDLVITIGAGSVNEFGLNLLEK